MKLINPTLEELDAAFAEKVAGWYRQDLACPTGIEMWRHPDHPYGWRERNGLPKFTRSMDAMLPWLEKQRAFIIEKAWGSENRIIVRVSDPVPTTAEADEAPLAAAIAMLRAHGVEVEFTQ